MVRPREVAPLKITRFNKAWKKLTGEELFVEGAADLESDYRRFADVFSQLFSVMRDDWRWQPQDWLDIQGFLWIALDESASKQPATATSLSTDEGAEVPMPVNLILYGPPGTGKTYSTAAEAVGLCGEHVPEDHATLMEVYQRLLSAGRIEFVTFHLAMSYEDFVEGRQPVTDSDEDADVSSAGFRLETVPGIFRRIAKRAETSRGRTTNSDAVTVANRQVFKMSIGEANNPEDAHLFEEALAGGYALLGWYDIDWSDEKYADRNAIITECKEQGHDDVNASSGGVQMPFFFRNWARKGDIVIVSKGNSLFRAIGEFTGDYEFHPRPEGGYAHRRAVRWHWTDREGVAVSEIYTRKFMQKSIYMLHESELDIPALERYINSQQTDAPAEPEPFVLIIDEINRANISKVFGELITLLEPDKRLGQPNALKVRLPYSGDDFGVPSNLHILATMNTADRSIALLDTALRRRFKFREMMPDASVLAEAAQTCELDLPQILETLNERIDYLYDREHQIGHAYFTGCKERKDVDAVMRDSVIPLLAEYFFEDWGKIAAVLGDSASHDGPLKGGFLKRSVVKPPPGLADGDDLPRFRWEVRSDDEGFDYSGLTEG
ncbi:MAG: AAA domain-containing protein [Gammaproteobacteria bacterium]|nr:AAA domain-containing protein [Gammaproteobacteria bacterium]